MVHGVVVTAATPRAAGALARSAVAPPLEQNQYFAVRRAGTVAVAVQGSQVALLAEVGVDDAIAAVRRDLTPDCASVGPTDGAIGRPLFARLHPFDHAVAADLPVSAVGVAAALAGSPLAAPSSHSSDPDTMPSPQSYGVGSMRQMAEQPSPPTVLPSSQVSGPTIMLSPQIGAQRLPGTRQRQPGLDRATARATIAVLRVAVVAALRRLRHAVAAGDSALARLAGPRAGPTELELTERRAPVARELVAVVALLARLEDPVSAVGAPHSRQESRATRDRARQRPCRQPSVRLRQSPASGPRIRRFLAGYRPRRRGRPTPSSAKLHSRS